MTDQSTMNAKASEVPVKVRAKRLTSHVACTNVRTPAGVARIEVPAGGVRGLTLRVTSDGTKTWNFRYRNADGAQRRMALGEFPAVGLAEAEARAGAQLDAVRNKRADPVADEAKARAEAVTFKEVFEGWVAQHAKVKLRTWRMEERRGQLHLLPALASVPFAKIERKDVREIRDNVEEKSGPIESNRVVALFNRVANWAVEDEIAKYNVAARLKKIGTERRRERVLSPEELRRLWHVLSEPLEVDRERGGITDADIRAAEAIRRGVKLLIITGQRRSEVIEAARSEFVLDGDDPTWTIPAERSKNGLAHRVPLTSLAIGLINEAFAAGGRSPWLFPSHVTNGPIRGDAVTKALHRLCRRMRPRIEGFGPHDIRRTVGTAMRRVGVSTEDRAHVFNHVSGAKSKVTSWNYDAGEHDVEKRVALERWERELRRVVGIDASNIITLNQKRA